MDPAEATVQPLSLQRLTAKSAKLLKRLMRVTEQGLGVARYTYSELPILWVVDFQGRIWFALEEIINIENNEFVFPRLRKTKASAVHQRLGHPALLGGAGGRIGGELIFNVDSSPQAWFINNASGRYGLQHGRTAAHLFNVSQDFARYGIRLRQEFIPTE